MNGLRWAERTEQGPCHGAADAAHPSLPQYLLPRLIERAPCCSSGSGGTALSELSL
jgi:hypothetical protein